MPGEGQEHRVELEPLGRMQGHQVDPVGPFLGRRVHDQRDMLHEARERVELRQGQPVAGADLLPKAIQLRHARVQPVPRHLLAVVR